MIQQKEKGALKPVVEPALLLLDVASGSNQAEFAKLLNPMLHVLAPSIAKI